MLNLSELDLQAHNKALQAKEAEDIIAWAVQEFSPRIALTCSFGGETGLVVAHMLSRIDRSVPIIFIDTDYLFPETYATMEAWVRRFGIRVQPTKPTLTPQEQAARYGPDLWERDPDLCCHLRKVLPMAEALQGLDAWMTGLRREQSSTRRGVDIVELHEQDGRSLVKINPLAHWSKGQVWAYLIEHDLPYNPLHDAGYKSIGCQPCTRPCQAGDERAGRWQGHEKNECGLHTFTQKVPAAK